MKSLKDFENDEIDISTLRSQGGDGTTTTITICSLGEPHSEADT